MDLSTFPMDVQFCEVIFESYSYSTEKVELDWLPPLPVSVPEGTKFQLPDFEFHHLNWTRTKIAYLAQHWDQLGVKFYFKVIFEPSYSFRPYRYAHVGLVLSETFRLLHSTGLCADESKCLYELDCILD